MNEAALTEWLAYRNAAFEADDLAWAKTVLPPGTSDTVVEITFHKARLACVVVSDEKRKASKLWLASKGYKEDF